MAIPILNVWEVDTSSTRKPKDPTDHNPIPCLVEQEIFLWVHSKKHMSRRSISLNSSCKLGCTETSMGSDSFTGTEKQREFKILGMSTRTHTRYVLYYKYVT